MHAMKQQGFSLIELMIAVAVVAVLAAIAFPSYQNSIVKGHRANAQQYMLDIASREQQGFLDSRAYTAGANIAAIDAALKTSAPKNLSNFYSVAVTTTAGPPPTFLITATPVPGSRQAKAGEPVMTLNSAGVKTPADKW